MPSEPSESSSARGDTASQRAGSTGGIPTGDHAPNACHGGDGWDVAPGFWSTNGKHTLKYAAWGDGYDEARLVDHGGGAFTVWYGQDGRTVGVLAHERDDDYEAGKERVEQGEPLP